MSNSYRRVFFRRQRRKRRLRRQESARFRRVSDGLQIARYQINRRPLGPGFVNDSPLAQLLKYPDYAQNPGCIDFAVLTVPKNGSQTRSTISITVSTCTVPNITAAMGRDKAFCVSNPSNSCATSREGMENSCRVCS